MITTLVKSLSFSALCTVLLVGCGIEEQKPASAAVLSRAQSLVPVDAALADIYHRSCVSCHAVAGSVAPLVGDKESWKPRMAKGMDTLLDNVINGFGGMPPFGLCMDCDAEQFEALINFMAQAE